MIAAISTNDRISARTSPARHIVAFCVYPPEAAHHRRSPRVPGS